MKIPYGVFLGFFRDLRIACPKLDKAYKEDISRLEKPEEKLKAVGTKLLLRDDGSQKEKEDSSITTSSFSFAW